MTHADSRVVARSGRTWSISTTNGCTTLGYLPDWAQGDPSRKGVAPDRLAVELSDITHEASFGGQFMRVCSGAECPGEESAVLIAYMQCSPFAGDGSAASVPLVSVQILDDVWIANLDPSGVVEAAEKFRSFADLLVNTVAPALSAAQADWAARFSVRHPQV